MSNDTKTEPFWRAKSLQAMTQDEWESLCDGCGKCCLHKVQDADTDEIYPTNVACRLLDLKSCRCTDYPNRKIEVPDCVQLSPETAGTLPWLPATCAYRLLAEGEDLPDWHPLITGDPASVHAAGVSIRGRSISEDDAGPLQTHLVDWPGL